MPLPIKYHLREEFDTIIHMGLKKKFLWNVSFTRAHRFFFFFFGLFCSLVHSKHLDRNWNTILSKFLLLNDKSQCFSWPRGNCSFHFIFSCVCVRKRERPTVLSGAELKAWDILSLILLQINIMCTRQNWEFSPPWPVLLLLLRGRSGLPQRNPREEVRPCCEKPHGNHAVGLLTTKKEDGVWSCSKGWTPPLGGIPRSSRPRSPMQIPWRIKGSFLEKFSSTT